MECYNFNIVIALIVGLTGIYTSTLVGWNPFWFSLDQLDWHSKISIERDASLCEYLLLSCRRIHVNKVLLFLTLVIREQLNIARLDYKDGDNHTPNPKRIDEMISFAGSPNGLGVRDFSAYRVSLEKAYPQSEWPGFIDRRVRCVQVALAMTAAGRGDVEVLGVRRISYYFLFYFTPLVPRCHGESKVADADLMPLSRPVKFPEPSVTSIPGGSSHSSPTKSSLMTGPDSRGLSPLDKSSISPRQSSSR